MRSPARSRQTLIVPLPRRWRRCYVSQEVRFGVGQALVAVGAAAGPGRAGVIGFFLCLLKENMKVTSLFDESSACNNASVKAVDVGTV